jgi:hypothetical protein
MTSTSIAAWMAASKVLGRLVKTSRLVVFLSKPWIK